MTNSTPSTHIHSACDSAFRRKPRIAGLPIEQEIHTASRLYRALLFASLTRRHHVAQLEDRIKALFGVALQLEKPGHAVTMANRLVINSTSLPPSTPGPLRTHLFHLIHSSLPTDRRTRHSRGVALEDVEPCAFACKIRIPSPTSSDTVRLPFLPGFFRRRPSPTFRTSLTLSPFHSCSS